MKLSSFHRPGATYGTPVRIRIAETHPQKPINPYGWTKFMTERILESYDSAYGFKFVALRYFNAAGATEKCGEQHDPEPHLIPNVLERRRRPSAFRVRFWRDYDTPDGTCNPRLHSHCRSRRCAHSSPRPFRKGNDSEFINLGNGRGFRCGSDRGRTKVTGRPIEINMEPQRPGDPPD